MPENFKELYEQKAVEYQNLDERFEEFKGFKIFHR